MKTLLLLLSSLLVLSGCESTRLSEVGPDQASEALRQVAGVWQFSHVGPLSFQSSQLQGVDVSELTRQQMEGSKFSIGENGQASFTGGGTSGSFRVKIVEVTPIYIKIRSPDGDANSFLVYDKVADLMVTQAPMTVNEDSEGTIPLYYKRS